MAKNGQWQLSAEAAELYERYVARHILGPWARLCLSMSLMSVSASACCWTLLAGLASSLAPRRNVSVLLDVS
jgi:hypothetical protein